MEIAWNQDWLIAMVWDDLVMMRAQKRKYIELSAAGARVLELLKRPRDFKSLCSDLDADLTSRPPSAAPRSTPS